MLLCILQTHSSQGLAFPWEMGICALQSLVTAEASLLEQGEEQEKEAQLMS